MKCILTLISTLCFTVNGLLAQGLACDYEAGVLHEFSLEDGSGVARTLVDGDTLYLHQTDLGLWYRVDVGTDGSFGPTLRVPSTDSGIELVTDGYLFLYEPDNEQMFVYAQPAIQGDAPLSVLDLPSSAGNSMVASYKDAIYLSQQNGTFRILDISDPLNPTPLDPTGLPHDRGFLMHIIEESDLGVTHDFNGVIRTLDLSDELNPRALSELHSPVTNPRNDIFYDGNTAYYLSGSEVHRYRFHEDGSISELTPLTLHGLMRPATSVRASGSRLWAYTSHGSYAYLLNDTSEPTFFNYVYHVSHWRGERSYQTRLVGEIHGYAVFAERIQLANSPDEMNIRIYDSNNIIRHPPFVWDFPGAGFKCHLYDDWMYRSQNASVEIYRFVGQEVSLEATASIATSSVHHATLLDDAFFTIDETTEGGRIISIDLTTPDQPVVQPPLTLSGAVPESAFFTRQRMYATSEEGVSIYDLSQGSTATLVGHLDLPPNIAGATGIGLLNPSTLLVSWDQLVLILDVSNELAPVIVGQISDPRAEGRYPYDIVPSPYSNLALIGWSPFDTQFDSPRPSLYEVSNPLSPVLTPFEANFGRHTSARFTPETLTVGYAVAGIDIHDVSVPDQPKLLRNIYLPFAGFTDFAQLENERLITYTDVGSSSGSTDRWIVYTYPDDCDFCELDYDLDRSVDMSDVNGFIEHYYAGDHYADRNRDGRINFFDVAQYIVEFQTACD